MVASCVALPRIRYLDMVYYSFAHLQKYQNTEMVFNPTMLNINEADFERKD